MRKKEDIVYEKDLGLEFDIPGPEEPIEEESGEPEDEEYYQDAPPVYDNSDPQPAYTGLVSGDRSSDWSRLVELEGKVARLEGKVDRIVVLLERLSEIYGKKNPSE